LGGTLVLRPGVPPGGLARECAAEEAAGLRGAGHHRLSGGARYCEPRQEVCSAPW
jgi:hypothetical protein